MQGEFQAGYVMSPHFFSCGWLWCAGTVTASPTLAARLGRGCGDRVEDGSNGSNGGDRTLSSTRYISKHVGQTAIYCTVDPLDHHRTCLL